MNTLKNQTFRIVYVPVRSGQLEPRAHGRPTLGTLTPDRLPKDPLGRVPPAS